jgi:hypothetical protein
MGLYHNHRPQAKEFRDNDNTKMEEGEIFAIETFGTTGRGYLFDGVCFIHAILLDVVSSDVAHSLDRKRPTIDVNLIAFHGFL